VSKSPAVHERTAHADELRRLSREHQHSHGRAGRETSENLERHSHLEVMKREREARRGERRRDSTFSRSTEEVKAQVLGVKQHRLWTWSRIKFYWVLGHILLSWDRSLLLHSETKAVHMTNPNPNLNWLWHCSIDKFTDHKLSSKPLTLDLRETSDLFSEGLAIIETRLTEKWRE
jgi:hypothetical protein